MGAFFALNSTHMKLKYMVPIKVRYTHWLPRLLRVAAITLYPYIFIAGSKEKTQNRLYKHEMTHIWQVVTYGWFRFYISYLLYFAAAWVRYRYWDSAYYTIPYEADAYNKQDEELTDVEKVKLGINETEKSDL